MSFGFPAYDEESWRPRQALNADHVFAASLQLGWKLAVEQTGPVGSRWKMNTSLNFWSWGEVVIVEPQPDGSVRVQSKCALFTQCLDWGKNRRNVERLGQILNR